VKYGEFHPCLFQLHSQRHQQWQDQHGSQGMSAEGTKRPQLALLLQQISTMLKASLSESTHLGIYCTEMKSIQPRHNRKEITRTNKGQNGKYSKNVLCVKRTDACAASAVSRTISAMTLVPPTMANLCRNGHVFPTFEWRKMNTMEDLGLL